METQSPSSHRRSAVALAAVAIGLALSLGASNFAFAGDDEGWPPTIVKSTGTIIITLPPPDK